MFETLTDRLTKTFSFLRDRKELTDDNIEEGLRAVRQALLEADVNFKVVKDFTDRVKERVVGGRRIQGVEASQQFVAAFHHELVQLMGPKDVRLEFAKNGPTIVLMAGLQGAGKTTTCAKLAKLMRDKHGRRPLLVAADVKRPAAVEQLKVLGRQINVPVFHKEGLAPPELCLQGVAYAHTAGADMVILDTAGRLHVDLAMMDEVRDIATKVRPTNTVLVVDAMTGQDAVNSAKAFDDALALSGVILTKLDGDARGGSAVSLKAVTGKPILFIGTGEKIDELDTFHVERMASRILGMGDVVGLVERAQSAISEKEASDSFEKLVMGSFTLEDMLAQLRMVRKLGPMKKVLGMMPGMSGLADQVNIDDKQMNRLEALFTSMTPRERLQPDLLDMGRRRRIARGSGQDVAAVNDLLKRFKEMKLMMKQLGKMGLGAKFGAKEKLSALKQMNEAGGMPGLGGGLSGFGGGGLGGLGAGSAEGPAAPGSGGEGKQLPGWMQEGAASRGGGGLLGGGLGGLFGGTRPMGASSTRQSGKKKDKKKKRR
ncbi:MAG: signal recognition particle protein [Planctomycetes bacterium]|nr:signal recognition particle protein [Planctomycetota bacterium]